jgi:hypothetical protein
MRYMILDQNNDICFNFKEFRSELDAELFLRYILGNDYDNEKSNYEIMGV